MSEENTITVNVGGITGTIDLDLANDLKIVHGIDAVAELTKALEEELKKEKENGLD